MQQHDHRADAVPAPPGQKKWTRRDLDRGPPSAFHAKIAGNRPGQRAGDDKIALGHAGQDNFRGAPHNFERAVDCVPFRGRAEIPPGPLGSGLQVQLDLFGGEWLSASSERDLAGERQARQAQQILVLDENAMERRLCTGRQPRRRIDRGAVLGGGVERNDDALDRRSHGREPNAEMARASSTAFAAKASRRAAIR